MKKTGKPVKDRKGYVHFEGGELPEFEYKKWLLENEVRDKKVKEAKSEKEKMKKEAADKTQKRRESIRYEKIYKLKEQIETQVEEMKEVTGQPPKKANIKNVVDLTVRINNEILKGNSIAETAHNVGLSRRQLEKFLSENYKAKTFKKYCKIIESKYRKVRMPSGAFKERNIRTWVHLPKDNCTFKDRLAANIDPIVSTENKSPSERLFPAPERNTPWSKEIAIVKDRTLQPIKRTRIAVHAFQTAGTWSNGQHLRKVSCTLAKSEEDKYLTTEGGIIVSRSFAHREQLDVGDKLLSITGLKGIISEIRKHSISDIIINKNMLWDETKMSRLCGSAILEVLNKDYKIFYQPEHQIRRFSKGNKVRFSPDLVPFLAYYLTSDELSDLQGENKDRFQDILYMLNLRFVNKNGYLNIEPKTTQVTDRKGGMLYDFNKVCWGKTKWEEGLSEPLIREGKVGFYPFILEKIWIPDWFILDQEGPLPVEEGSEYVSILDKLRDPEVFINFGIESISLLYIHLFAHIPESISYLVAVPKNSQPNEIGLNRDLCIDNSIEEGDYVFVIRYPVVQKENIQKMKVRFADIPDKTLGINIESMVLMNGDFDGDPLYILKIPQTENFGKPFEIEDTIYKEKRKKIEKDIHTIDEQTEISLLDERRIKIEQRKAFLTSKQEEGGDKRKLPKFLRTIDNVETGHIRTDTELIQEAKSISNSLDASGVKAEKIGTLTKWMWFTTGEDTRRDEEAIKCVASLEIIKDKVSLKNEAEYKKSVDLLKKCKRTIEYENIRTGRFEPSMQAKMFKAFVSKNTYKQGNERNFPKLGNLKGKPLVRSGTPYAKFILSLCGV